SERLHLRGHFRSIRTLTEAMYPLLVSVSRGALHAKQKQALSSSSSRIRELFPARIILDPASSPDYHTIHRSPTESPSSRCLDCLPPKPTAAELNSLCHLGTAHDVVPSPAPCPADRSYCCPGSDPHPR